MKGGGDAKYKQKYKKDSTTGADNQLRCYPADPKCKHRISAAECFCVDKCAQYLQTKVEVSYEDDVAAGWLTTQTDAPFHKLIVKVANENTYSIIADPLLQHIPWDLRVPGIWHCMHNCRTAMWILLKDPANKYGAPCREGLKQAMGKLGLGKIKVAATNRPKKLGPGFENSSHIEYLILHEQSEPDRVKAVEAEVKNEGCERTAMDGQELEKVMKLGQC